MRAQRNNLADFIMNTGANEPEMTTPATDYNDSSADAFAALAILTIVIAAAVFWVAGQ
jgi:hypothetical protein